MYLISLYFRFGQHVIVMFLLILTYLLIYLSLFIVILPYVFS